MEHTDSKRINSEELLDFFRFGVSSNTAGYPTTSQRAFNSFISSLGNCDITDAEDLSTAVGDWLVRMQVNGLSLNTAIGYFKSVRALYSKAVKEGIAPQTDAFTKRMELLRDKGAQLWQQGVSEQDGNILMDLTKSTVGAKQEANIAADMVVLSLLNGCRPINKVAACRYEEIPQPSDEIQAIMERNKGKGNNRKYLFPLDQGNLTARQLEQKTENAVKCLFAKNKISPEGSIDDSLKSYWAYTAMRAGYAPHEIRACFGTAPHGLGILELCEPCEISEPKRNEIIARVGTLFIDNPLRWFALGLRHGVKFRDIITHVENKKDFRAPEFFYPCEEIVRRIGKKKTVDSKPILPNVVFMRTRRTEISGILHRIGDLAWCYTLDGKHGSNYAAISTDSFRRFQRAINIFTPDYEVAAAGDLTLQPGERIVVLDGSFQNQEVSIDSIEQMPQDKKVIYRFSLVSENGAKWEIGIDARFTRKK